MASDPETLKRAIADAQQCGVERATIRAAQARLPEMTRVFLHQVQEEREARKPTEAIKPSTRSVHAPSHPRVSQVRTNQGESRQQNQGTEASKSCMSNREQEVVGFVSGIGGIQHVEPRATHTMVFDGSRVGCI